MEKGKDELVQKILAKYIPVSSKPIEEKHKNEIFPDSSIELGKKQFKDLEKLNSKLDELKKAHEESNKEIEKRGNELKLDTDWIDNTIQFIKDDDNYKYDKKIKKTNENVREIVNNTKNATKFYQENSRRDIEIITKILNEAYCETLSEDYIKEPDYN